MIQLLTGLNLDWICACHYANLNLTQPNSVHFDLLGQCELILAIFMASDSLH